MKEIGEKIREIRKENGWSQDSIYPGHQSLVSQIEKGIIKNPSKETLEIIAKNLETTFEELIKDTSWDPTKAQVGLKGQYAFSTMDFSVTLPRSGIIIITMKAYPLYNEGGEENRFSPETGEELITCCKDKSCRRRIERPTQQYCMGCGKRIIPHLPGLTRMETSDFWCNLKSNNFEQVIHREHLKLSASSLKDACRSARNPDELIESGRISGDRQGWENLLDHLGLLDTDDINGGFIYHSDRVSGDDFFDKLDSKNADVRNYWWNHYARERFCEDILEELKRYEVAIRSGEIEDISDIEKNVDETIISDSEEKDS